MTLLLTPTDIDVAVELLVGGGLVAFPTETVYGLGADASNSSAVERVFEAKGRPAGHPLIVHLGSARQLNDWARDLDDRAHRLAEAFWPGPLTLVVESAGRAASAVTGGRSTIGLRVPDHPLTAELLARFDGGLAGPSANRFGHVSPTTAEHVMADLTGRVDAVLDGGPATVGLESTIVEVLADRPTTILRPGGVTADEVAAVVGEDVVDGRSTTSRAAGMLASHYAPTARVLVLDAPPVPGELSPGTVLVGPEVGGCDPRLYVPVPADAIGFARQLYAALRDADEREPETIAVVVPSEGALLDAIRDRLSKASGPRE